MFFVVAPEAGVLDLEIDVQWKGHLDIPLVVVEIVPGKGQYWTAGVTSELVMVVVECLVPQRDIYWLLGELNEHDLCAQIHFERFSGILEMGSAKFESDYVESLGLAALWC